MGFRASLISITTIAFLVSLTGLLPSVGFKRGLALLQVRVVALLGLATVALGIYTLPLQRWAERSLDLLQ